ncbi:MAG: hypothetical protein GC162_17065 [Planctomycetes bacterium]|nr:hypothetical protein [Planctomycetota bacterium]
MTDKPAKHVVDLFAAYSEEQIGEEQMQRLEAMLQDDAEARQQFLMCTLLRASLQERYATPAVEIIPEAPASLPGRRQIWRWAGRIAAMLLISAGVLGALWLGRSHGKDQSGSGPAAPVAVLTESDDVVWGRTSMDAEQLVPGASLTPGRLRLVSGRVQVLYNSGAVVTIHGPSDYEILADNQGRLASGSMLAYVPPRARGFTVQGPRGLSVMDLGTEFEMRVDRDGRCGIDVLQGRVALINRDQYEELTAGGAAHTTVAGRIVLVGATPEQIRYVHYSFDEPAGDPLEDAGQGFIAGPYPAALRFTEPGKEGPDRIAGPFGMALSFDGINDYVQTQFPGIGGSKPRTVAMWARIAPDASTKDSLALLSYGRFEHEMIWQMSWNTYAADGAMGALRVGVMGDQIVGKTDLRDGKWHHLAATFDGSTARLYVDGQLDATHEMAHSIDTEIGRGATPMVLGRNVKLASGSDQFFRGAIDEVYVIDDALNANEIGALMHDNALPERLSNGRSRNGGAQQ